MSSQDESKIWEALLAQADAMDEAAPDPNELAELACGSGLQQSRQRTAGLAFADPRLLRDARLEHRLRRAARLRGLRRGGLVAAAFLICFSVGQQITPSGPAEFDGTETVATAVPLPDHPLLSPIGDDELALYRASDDPAPSATHIAWPRGYAALDTLTFATTRPAHSRLEVVDTLTGVVHYQSALGAADPTTPLGAEHVGLLLEVRILSDDGRILERSAFGITEGPAPLPAAVQQILDTLPEDEATRAFARANLRLGHYRAASEALDRLSPDQAVRERQFLAASVQR